MSAIEGLRHRPKAGPVGPTDRIGAGSSPSWTLTDPDAGTEHDVEVRVRGRASAAGRGVLAAR
jgi:hypothetical protein